MDRFDLQRLMDAHRQADRRYLEFFRAASMSMGIYVLGEGDVDPQQPHGEDELYYVISGQATFRQGDEEQAVGPGSMLFVSAGAEHRFLRITETLRLLVVFAPAEGSNSNVS